MRVSSLSFGCLVCLFAVAACDGGEGNGGTARDGGSSGETRTLTHRFPSFEIGPGEELFWRCQSWTLDNEEPLFINAVESTNDGAWHHSNWFFVPDSVYDGEDGTWPCGERSFDEVSAAIGRGRGVLYAQSTQAASETQEFPDGAAYRIPAHARVVGDVHLLNVTGEALETSIEMTLHAIPESEVETELFPMSFTNMGLRIPARAKSRFTMECDLERHGNPISLGFHYVLPHYHDLGELLQLGVETSSGETMSFFETTSSVGEPLGKSYDPPRRVEDISKLRFTCGYDNPRDEAVGYGIGDQEMCVFLAYHDGERKIAGLGEETTAAGEQDGVQLFETDCAVAALR